MQCNIANFFTGPQRFSGYVAFLDTYSIFDGEKNFSVAFVNKWTYLNYHWQSYIVNLFIT